MTSKQLNFLGEFVAAVLAVPEIRTLTDPEQAALKLVTIAQGCLEAATPPQEGDTGAVTDKGGWGTSPLYLDHHNPFGIQFSQRDAEYGYFDYQSWEMENGKRVDKEEKFQVYPSLTVGIEDHQSLLLRKRQVLRALPTGWQNVCVALGPPIDATHCGYSTNPQYAMTLLSIVKHARLDDPRMLTWYATGEDPARRPVV